MALTRAFDRVLDRHERTCSTSLWSAAPIASAIVGIATSSFLREVGLRKEGLLGEGTSAGRDRRFERRRARRGGHAGRILRSWTTTICNALLEEVRRGEPSTDEAAARPLARLPFADLGFARVDHHRELRQALPRRSTGRERAPRSAKHRLRAPRRAAPARCCSPVRTRVRCRATLARCPGGERTPHRSPLRGRSAWSRSGARAVARAGSGGHRDRRHRRLPPSPRSARRHSPPTASRRSSSSTAALPASTACSPLLDVLEGAEAIVVVAGMEGALASCVVGGLVAAPVVAVPTSVDYGAARPRG